MQELRMTDNVGFTITVLHGLQFKVAYKQIGRYACLGLCMNIQHEARH